MIPDGVPPAYEALVVQMLDSELLHDELERAMYRSLRTPLECERVEVDEQREHVLARHTAGELADEAANEQLHRLGLRFDELSRSIGALVVAHHRWLKRRLFERLDDVDVLGALADEHFEDDVRAAVERHRREVRRAT